MPGVYSSKYNINFFYIPKCACTVTRQLWYHLHSDEMINEVPTCDWHLIADDFLPPNPEAPGYIAVRNPYYRAVSMYTNRFCGSFDDSIISRQHMTDIMGDVSPTFLNFCRYLQKSREINWIEFNFHFWSQKFILDMINNSNLLLIRCQEADELTNETQDVNMCRQYKETYQKLLGHSDFDEKIDQFFKQVHDKNMSPRTNNFDPNIDYVNTDLIGSKVFPPHSYFLTPETKAILAEVYREDFECLNYPI